MKLKSLGKISPKAPVKVEPLTHFAELPPSLKTAGLAFPKEFQAAVVMDRGGTPRYFVFDTPSLWDLLCAADEAFEKAADAKTYVSRNPVGWLIDAIEAHLPLNPRLVAKLKRGLKEATTRGLVSFEKVMGELGLS